MSALDDLESARIAVDYFKRAYAEALAAFDAVSIELAVTERRRVLAVELVERMRAELAKCSADAADGFAACEKDAEIGAAKLARAEAIVELARKAAVEVAKWDNGGGRFDDARVARADGHVADLMRALRGLPHVCADCLGRTDVPTTSTNRCACDDIATKDGAK